MYRAACCWICNNINVKNFEGYLCQLIIIDLSTIFFPFFRFLFLPTVGVDVAMSPTAYRAGRPTNLD